MKIILVHNFYGSSAPSGENSVFEAEGRLLRQRGQSVSTSTKHSDSIRAKGIWGALEGACSTPWNPIAAKALQQLVIAHQPDVVHAHNTFPLLSPSIFHAIGHRAARVLTLHNYRLFCPAAIPMRAGKVCTDCLDRRSVLPAITHGCYRGSRLATLPLVANVSLHRLLGTWTQKVDAFIALTEFQRVRMVEAGLPADLVHVKPNFYPGQPKVVPWSERRPFVVFAGRLTAEKGVLALVRTWLDWGGSSARVAPHRGRRLTRRTGALGCHRTGCADPFPWAIDQHCGTRRDSQCAVACVAFRMVRGIPHGGARSIRVWHGSCCVQYWTIAFHRSSGCKRCRL